MVIVTRGHLLLAIGAAGIGALLVLSALDRTEFRPWVSAALKHAPLCFAENREWLAPRRAYYSIRAGKTVDVLKCAPHAPPALHGHDIGHSLIVVSDLGGVVQRFAPDGSLVWSHALRSPRGLDVEGEIAHVGAGKRIHLLDVATGAERMALESPEYILAIKVRGDSIVLTHDIDGDHALAEYAVQAERLRLQRTFASRLQYPRGLDLRDGELFVADTFGHRLLRLDAASWPVRSETASYVPNSIQALGDHVLVAEEHLNRIGEFLRSMSRLPASLACRTVRGVNTLDEAEAVANRPGPDGESICRAATVESEDLFSPNDARELDGSVYIADSDNHRVVVFRQGHFWSALTGFNSPINGAPIPAPIVAGTIGSVAHR